MPDLSPVPSDDLPADLLLQYVFQQRGERPTGFRISAEGRVWRVSAETPLPNPIERLDKDRPLLWVEQDRLSQGAFAELVTAVRRADLFSLPPRLLINYCKEDPPAGLWAVALDGQTAQIVVYDPRPKRHAALDMLLDAVQAILG